MSTMSQSLRHRRYNLKPEAKISFVIQGTSGQIYQLPLLNMSLSGLAIEADEAFLKNENIDLGSIMPSAKIMAGENEFSLGRVAIRSVPQDLTKQKLIGLSLLDTRLPLQGKLSHFLEMDFDKNADPTKFELNPDAFNLAHFAENDERSVDLFSKAKTFSEFLEDWEVSPKYGYFRVRNSGRGTRINLTHKRPNGRNDYISMGSNDYLGLAAHPQVEESAHQALKEFGFGSTGSPVTSGLTRHHEELTDYLKAMYKTEACILYNSGYAANVGIIDGLIGPSDLVVADMLSHASLQDGIRMARGTKRYFKHNDFGHLANILKKERADAAGCLVITEGVFSMDGDVPPLKTIFDVARQNNARVMCDEAHSMGVIGENGLGATEEAGLVGKIDIVMGTFSKICGGIGGFVCADQAVIDWLKFFSRSFMFSVSIPPSTAAAAVTALKIFQQDKERRQRLQGNIKQFTTGLRELGLNISPNHRSSVTPVVIGNEKLMGKIHQDLISAGIYVIPIVYPAVSRKESRFRFTMTSELTTSDLDYVLSILKQSFEKHNFIPDTGVEKKTS